MSRSNDRLALNQKDWDVVIIGGGITGVAVAKEAAAQGLKALLLEQKDFAWGSSSRSSKMVHGGLRYIAQGDIKLTAHSLSEREKLLKSTHGLVYRMGYHFVHFKSQFPGRLPLFAVVFLYNALARFWDYQYLSPFKFLRKIPNYRSDNLLGATYYSDALTDDARLVLRVLDEAKETGAIALNYVAVTQVDPDKNGFSVTVLDELNQYEVRLNAAVVVNATGAWAGLLRERFTQKPNVVRPQRGSHLVVSQERLPLSEAIILQHPADRRVMFIYPWEGKTVIGTTDLDHLMDLNEEASITTDEVRYLLHAANDAFPKAQLTYKDVIATFSGIRPIVSSGIALSPSQEKRQHSVWNDNGFITVTGGKLTTFRLIAQDVMRVLLRHLKKDKRKKIDSLVMDAEALTDDMHLNPELLTYIKSRYGFKTDRFLKEMPLNELVPIHHSVRTLIAEMRWAMRYESVAHLDDLLLRRTRLGLLLSDGAADLLQMIRPMLRDELGWDEALIEQEEQRYKAIYRRYYSLPMEVADTVLS